MKKLLLTALLCTSCATWTPQEAAIATTATNIATVAATAAATFYGGPMGGQLASAGLSALAQVMNGYIGSKLPKEMITASPGVSGVGQSLVGIIAPDHVITAADQAKVQQAAAIAAQLKNVVVIPKKS